jgi:hypothetical protein
MEKLCPTCKKLKTLLEFSKNKLRKDGLQRECKVCCKANHDKHYYSKKSPTRWKTPDEPGLKTCTDCKEVKPHEQYSKLKAGKYGLASRCKECTAKRHNAWRQGSGKEWENNYTRTRKNNDPEYKVKYLLRMRLLDAIKRHATGGKVSKKHSAIGLLGCTIEEAVGYLEKQFLAGMTWGNHGIVWEIDHIRPCAFFNLENLEEQKECFNFKNLQPLFITTKIAEKYGHMGHVGNRNKLNKIF